MAYRFSAGQQSSLLLEKACYLIFYQKQPIH
jgi:hypothetical protein